MFLPGARPTRAPSGTEQILACLADLQRSGGILRIEDARGQEVPARLPFLSAGKVIVAAAGPLDLGPGDATNLVFIQSDTRFKAPTRVQAQGPLGIALDLPVTVQLADRRKRSRGYLNVALVGLFSPMAAAGAGLEASYAYAYESGSHAVATERPPVAEAQPQALPLANLLRAGPASGSGPFGGYLNEWLQNRTLAMSERHYASGLGLPGPGEPGRFRHGGLSGHGVSFHFLPCSLPGNWLGANRMRFEAHIDRHNVLVGVRIK